jgi:predicted nuclease of predicted toxin-antitoxin system
VRLLLDQNLSWRLARLLESKFPEVTHVSTIGLSQATDQQIWLYAMLHEFIIVSKDSDFQNLVPGQNSFPKFIWITIASARTTTIAQTLLDHFDHIYAFAQSTTVGLILPVRPPEETAKS